MSVLIANERGFALPQLTEELSRKRHALKYLTLPSSSGPAHMYVWARHYPDAHEPLQIRVNDTEVDPIVATDVESDVEYRWCEATVPGHVLKPGENRFELWTDSAALNAWSLGVEYGAPGASGLTSRDGGRSWQEQLGYLNVARGEYLVRVRLPEGVDPVPPAFTQEEPPTAQTDDLRQLIHSDVQLHGNTVERARQLATWVSTRWRYRNAQRASFYTPWDPLTIIAWGSAGRGHAGRPPIAFCVHYAVTFVSACLAFGMTARCIVLAESPNSRIGHFAAEVWSNELGKWVFVDANEDALFVDEQGIPMSTAEVHESRTSLDRLVRWGPGHRMQARSAAMRRWIKEAMLTGRCFSFYGVWPRTDFLVHPEECPPSHGWGAYSELGFVWQVEALQAGFGMFRNFAGPEWFRSPPGRPAEH